MFVSFGVSSPVPPSSFAIQQHKKQSRYGTRLHHSNRATVLISLAQRAKTWFSRAFAPGRITPNVNLEKLGFRQLGATVPMASLIDRAPTMQFAGAPIDIRVTDDAIFEVYGEAGPAERCDAVNERSMSGDATSADRRDNLLTSSVTTALTASDWTSSDEARRGSPDAIARGRAIRRVRTALVYAGFVALIGFAAWYAMR
jgi:hypothetical protein